MKARRGKQALVVLGMHRSGTSAVTGAIASLGVQLGRQLYRGHKGINDKGYFEHSDIADNDDEVLLTLGSFWDDILPLPDAWWQRPELDIYGKRLKKYLRRDFSKAQLWGVKDPRVCRLLPWWQRVLGELSIDARYLIVVRHPLEVARSLQRRDGFSLEKSLLLWSDHNLQAERWTRGAQRTFLSFDRLLENPQQELERIEQTLDIQFPVSVPQAMPAIDTFLTAGLRHHHGDQGFNGSDEVSAIAKEIYERFADAAQGRDEAVAENDMSKLEARFEGYRGEFSPLLSEHITSVSAHRAELQRVTNKVFGSWSWVLGKPIRVVERLLGRNV